MAHKKQIQNKLKHAVLIAEPLITDFEHASPFIQIGIHSTLDQTVHWLSENNVEEVFIFYSHLKKEVEEWANGKDTRQMKFILNYMKVDELNNFGDVMREIHFRNLLSQDFLVLYADNLTNLNLSRMISNHFQKKSDLKNVVLTTAMQISPSSTIYILNSLTSQILQIQSQPSAQFTLNTDKINLKKISVEFHRDLAPIDMHICTIQVVKSFKENFEYQSMQDFIIGMLTSDVYEEKINAYVLQRAEMSFRVNKASQFYKCYMSYICGYLHPYTVGKEAQLSIKGKGKSEGGAITRDFNKLIRKGAKISSDCTLSHNVYIGRDSIVSAGCSITKSIVLDNVNLHKGVALNHCIVLPGCQLSANSHYQYSLIEKVGESIKIHCFRGQMNEEVSSLISKEIFLETPDAGEQIVSFQEQLSALISQKIDEQTILGDLRRIRKEHGKSAQEVTAQILKTAHPQGVKGIQTFTSTFGTPLLALHDSPFELIQSFYAACANSEDYLKAFHILLQYLYHQDILEREAILEWWEEKEKTEGQMLITAKLCKKFIEDLKEDDDNEDEEQDTP